MSFGTVTVHTSNPDPSWAVHAFCRVMERARSLGLMPRTEHTLAEQLFRGEARLLFYSSAGGITALCMDDDALSDDDAFEMVEFVMRRRKQRIQERRAEEAAQGMPAMPETGTGSAPKEGQPGPLKADAPDTVGLNPSTQERT